jgi:hypothetical protein
MMRAQALHISPAQNPIKIVISRLYAHLHGPKPRELVQILPWVLLSVADYHESQAKIIDPEGTAVQLIRVHVQQQVPQRRVRGSAKRGPAPAVVAGVPTASDPASRAAAVVGRPLLQAAVVAGSAADRARRGLHVGVAQREGRLLRFPDRQQGRFEVRRVAAGIGGHHNLQVPRTPAATAGAAAIGTADRSPFAATGAAAADTPAKGAVEAGAAAAAVACAAQLQHGCAHGGAHRRHLP